MMQLSNVLSQGRQAGGLFTGGHLEDIYAYSAIATSCFDEVYIILFMRTACMCTSHQSCALTNEG